MSDSDQQRFEQWKASIALYRKNAEGLGFTTKVRVDEGKIKISNNAPEQYKAPIFELAKYIADCQFAIENIIDPYFYSLPGFEEELNMFYPELLEEIFNKGFDAFLMKLWNLENVIGFKYSMKDIKSKNGEWVLEVRMKEGIKDFYRRNGRFEDEEGKTFMLGMGFEALWWNLFDDKAEYKIPIINSQNLTNLNNVA